MTKSKVRKTPKRRVAKAKNPVEKWLETHNMNDWKMWAREAITNLRKATRAQTMDEAGEFIEQSHQDYYEVMNIFWDRKEDADAERYSSGETELEREMDEIPSTSQIHLPRRAWNRLYKLAKRSGVDIHTMAARLILEESWQCPAFPEVKVPMKGPVQ